MSALLQPGARVVAIAPSHAYDPERLAAGLAIAREAGVDVTVPSDTLAPHRRFAHDQAHRQRALLAALTDPTWDAVWAIRGGSGVTALLPTLPWDRLPPRLVIGFSDLTPLLDALRARVGSPVVHGPVLNSLPATSPTTRAAFFDLLAGRDPVLRGATWIPGAARGALVGGNLALLAATCGTPFQTDARGAILCLEEIDEPAWRVERMLVQLRQAGVFTGAAAVALGSFTGCHPPADAGWTLSDALLEHLAPLGVPVLADLPFGHGPDNVGLPLGRVATLADGALSWAPLAPSAPGV